MAKAKCPYTWPHRSRKAMVEYLSEHEHYHPMNSVNGGFVLSWNIKVYDPDSSGTWEGKKTRDDLNDAWEQHVRDTPDLFYQACENALRMWIDGEWTNYPGIEKGDWKFGVNGRSGGYLILTDAPGWCPAPRAWRMFRMIWDDSASYRDWLDSLDTATLRKFYRAVRVIDHDLSRDKIKAEMKYQYHFLRTLWEEERDQEETARAEEIEASRPDMQ